LLPMPFQELFNLQTFPLEEQLHQLTAALKEQFPRHCFIKIQGQETQPLLVPVIKDLYTEEENLIWYGDYQLGKQEALPAAAVDELLIEQEKTSLLFHQLTPAGSCRPPQRQSQTRSRSLPKARARRKPRRPLPQRTHTQTLHGDTALSQRGTLSLTLQQMSKKLSSPTEHLPVPVQLIERRIRAVRRESYCLRQQVKRNRQRFPSDFMFQLTAEEADVLVSQNVIPSPPQPGRFPAFMRAFVQLRQLASTHKDLAEKIAAMEKKYDARFRVVFQAIKKLLEPPPRAPVPKRRIGFTTEEK
jgi:hypothetical protein